MRTPTPVIWKVVRWGGLGALITAFLAPALQLPGAQYLAPWLFVIGVGCWIALVVHYFRSERPRRQAGMDSSR